jgi:hypothetical protein
MQSLGLGYKFQENLSVRLGVAVKETVADQFPESFTDDPETEEIEKSKVEAGLESVVDYSKAINENTNLSSKIELFSNLEAFNKTDVRWETKITTKVSDFIQFGANLLLYYDHDISPKRQLYETVAIAVSYTLK